MFLGTHENVDFAGIAPVLVSASNLINEYRGVLKRYLECGLRADILCYMFPIEGAVPKQFVKSAFPKS